MKMKKTVTLIKTLLLVLLAFRGFATDNDEEYLNEFQYRYISREQVKISKGITITEILTFIEYNDNYDYDFTVFKNPKNETISMHGGPGPEDNFTKGEKVEVIWELTTLYEAGEGDAPYYFWSIVDIIKIYNKISLKMFKPDRLPPLKVASYVVLANSSLVSHRCNGR